MPGAGGLSWNVGGWFGGVGERYGVKVGGFSRRGWDGMPRLRGDMVGRNGVWFSSCVWNGMPGLRVD
ncbi:hypothetical protein AAC387_Pa02g4648 [Persea americana]